nr:MAG TPA: hypothetical protein [Bacteriophage sp.]
MMQAGSGIPGPPHLVGNDYHLPTLHKFFYNTPSDLKISYVSMLLSSFKYVSNPT